MNASLKNNSTNNYSINLKTPDLKNQIIYSKIADTTCVQYSDNTYLNPTPCFTWYDYEINNVVCICQSTGLIVNVNDVSLANLAKLSQFPNVGLTFSNIFM